MTRFAIDNRVERAADLKGFASARYRFASELSTETEWVFVRPQPEPGTPMAQSEA